MICCLLKGIPNWAFFRCSHKTRSAKVELRLFFCANCFNNP